MIVGITVQSYKGINLTIVCRSVLSPMKLILRAIATFVCATLTRLVSLATHVALFIRGGMPRVRLVSRAELAVKALENTGDRILSSNPLGENRRASIVMINSHYAYAHANKQRNRKYI